MTKKRIHLTESDLRNIIKESVCRILTEARFSAKKSAFKDMAAENRKVRDYNNKAEKNNDDLDIIDSYQEARLRYGRDPKKIGWRKDCRGRCIADRENYYNGPLGWFFYDTRNKKDKREDLAKIIRGEKPRPQLMDYIDEPYDIISLDNRYDDIDKAISSDVDALDSWNDF